jgi:hypothetical protein
MIRMIIVIGLLAFACRSITAHAQPAPPFCVSQSAVQGLVSAVQTMMEAAAEPQRTAKAVADAVAAQKAEDAKAKEAPKP